MNEEELKEEIEEIREEQKILCRRYSSEEEDDNLIMKDQRRLDKGYNKRINQILKERSSWYNIALEVDEILIILLKARLEGFQKGKLEQKKEELRFLNDFGISSFLKYEEDIKKLNNRIKQLQKEINSQTEQNSDKEVAQPYSKSDKTTKEIGSNSK
jgi:hypothetical protein